MTVQYLENDYLKVGFELEWGGELVHFEDKLDGGKNFFVPERSDVGGICVSLWGDGSPDEGEDFSGKPWNPIQGTNDQYETTGNITYTLGATTFYCKSNPIAFTKYPSAELVRGMDYDMVIELWAELIDDHLSLRYKCTYTGGDRSQNTTLYGETEWDQEYPTVCVSNGVDAWNYVGLCRDSAAWQSSNTITTEELVTPSAAWGSSIKVASWANPFGGFTTSEQWVALLNSDLYGIGVYGPDNDSFTALDNNNGWAYYIQCLLNNNVWGEGTVTPVIKDLTIYLTAGTPSKIRDTFSLVAYNIGESDHWLVDGVEHWLVDGVEHWLVDGIEHWLVDGIDHYIDAEGFEHFIVPAAYINPVPGIYGEAQSVSFTPHDGWTYLYSLDGSDPIVVLTIDEITDTVVMDNGIPITDGVTE